MPEFRLYYELTTGVVICYTCENLEGTFIVVDAITFAEARPDIRVIDGEVVRNNRCIITRLTQDSKGIKCASNDVTIIVSDDYDDVKYWSIQNYEFINR